MAASGVPPRAIEKFQTKVRRKGCQGVAGGPSFNTSLGDGVPGPTRCFVLISESKGGRLW